MISKEKLNRSTIILIVGLSGGSFGDWGLLFS